MIAAPPDRSLENIFLHLQATEIIMCHATLVALPDVVVDHVAVVNDRNVAVEHRALQFYPKDRHALVPCFPDARFSSLWR